MANSTNATARLGVHRVQVLRHLPALPAFDGYRATKACVEVRFLEGPKAGALQISLATSVKVSH